MAVDVGQAVNQKIVELFAAKSEALKTQLGKTRPDLPFVLRRGAHPKHHGLVRALFTVRPDVPRPLREGLFAAPRTYPAYVRFSNAGSDWDDRAKDAHGMAIKLLDVPGPKLLNDEQWTHDFVLVDGPVFIARDPDDFLQFLMLTARIARAKEQGNAVEVEALTRELATRFPNVARLRRLIRNPLFVPYFSQTAYALGPGRAVKYRARPRRVERVEPSSTELDARPDPSNYLAEAMALTLDSEDAVFDFQVQWRETVGNDRLIEDPTIEWTEDQAPFETVATISIPRQKFTWPAQRAFAENVSFNPWHAREEHRPLGAINETRRDVYVEMLQRRHRGNGIASREPTGICDY
jgi:catalase